MRMCQPHWDKLRAAIEARGLSSLVAETGEQAASNLASEVQRGRSIDNFDPLMGAHNAVVSNALSWLGPALLLPDEDGSEKCPICTMTTTHAASCRDAECHLENYDHWVEHAADDMVKAWQELRP